MITLELFLPLFPVVTSSAPKKRAITSQEREVRRNEKRKLKEIRLLRHEEKKSMEC